MPVLDYQKSQAYLRDRFVPFKEANLSIASSPVLYGLSTYTVFMANWNKKQRRLYIFRLRDHYQRLVNSAKIMDFHEFEGDWPYEKFKQTMIELLKNNRIQEDALVRVTVFIDELIAGTKIRGLRNSLSAYIYPAGQLLPAEGAHLCVSSWTRTADNAIPARAKVNGSYINASLMKNEALMNGYDDTITLDHNGHVTESSVANIFIVRNGKLITPASSTDLLEGITKDTVLKLGNELGIVTEERTIDRSELYLADEAFLCGSSARITPVLSVDRRPISRSRGKVTELLQRKYKATVYGMEPDREKWLICV